jgi:hypothetical protein
MLRILAALMILSSCSMGTIKTGGEKSYIYDSISEYDLEELTELSSKVVQTSKRDPQVGKLGELFTNKQKPLKRIGIIIFESEIQPTRGGLADKNEVYLSEQGKQLVTEKFLKIWEETVKVIAPDIDYVPTSKIKQAPSFHKYGLTQDDYLKAHRSSLAPDDIFFLEAGKKTTMVTTLNPRGMRDMSFALVPASELMSGPKWSEQNKHFLNDVAKELKLDAVIIVMSHASWTTAHMDKHSGEFFPEELTIKVKASTLIPLSEYHARLESLKINDRPGVTLAYRTYVSKISAPIFLSLPQESKNFESIENEVISPMFKIYKDLSQMTLIQIVNDLKKTW